jgi:hypothetical protein
MRPGNPALDALRRNVSGKVASGEAVAIVAITLCPHCARAPVTDGRACDYCRGFAHRPAGA